MIDELEMSVLGAILLSKDKTQVEQAFSKLIAECFTEPELAQLFTDLREQCRINGRVDVILTLKNLGAAFKPIMKACMELV